MTPGSRMSSERQLRPLERGVLVLMARVGELQAERADLRLVEHGQHLRQRDVVNMRPVIVAPAAMEPDAIARDAGQRLVQRRDVRLGDLEEFGGALVLEQDRPLHREVGRIDLQHEVGRDQLVLLAHLARQGEDIGLVAVVVGVQHRRGDDAGRGRRHEGVGGRRREAVAAPSGTCGTRPRPARDRRSLTSAIAWGAFDTLLRLGKRWRCCARRPGKSV